MPDNGDMLLAGAVASWVVKTILERVFGRNKDLDDIRAEQRLQADRITRIEADAQKNEELFRKDIHQLRNKVQEGFLMVSNQLDELKQGFAFVPLNPSKTPNRRRKNETHS